MGQCGRIRPLPASQEEPNVTSQALPYLAAARVEGPDAAAFLQAQLSAEVAALPDGGATFACHCSPRGQVYGLLLVAREPALPPSGAKPAGMFYLVGAAELLPSILERLGRFVLRARVGFDPAAGLVVCGVPPERAPATGAYRTLPGLSYRVVAAESPAECAPGAANDWKARELRHGIAWLGTRTSERFIPQMLGFDQIGAVSFAKGCYPGQEIVARARYLGTVKRRPLRLLVDRAPAIPPGAGFQVQTGDDWLDATAVDSASLSGSRKTLLLAVAPVPAGTVGSLEYEGRGYRCATI